MLYCVTSSVTPVKIHSSLFSTDLNAQAYAVKAYPLQCRFCRPGVEFHNMVRQECQMCTPVSVLKCPPETLHIACAAERDAYCPETLRVGSNGFCNNGFVDFGEQCDASATNTATAACCTALTCTLLPGYYTDPACSTICGDGILAGLEECDDMNDLHCDIMTCRVK